MVPLLVAIALVAATISSARADGHHPLGGSAVVDVPAGGTGTVTSGDFSKKVTDADIIMGADVGDSEVFRNMALLLLGIESDKRNVGCLNFGALAHQDVMDALSDQISETEVESRAALHATAVSLMCLRIARLLAEIDAESGRPGHQAARATRCGAIPFAVKVRTTRAEDGSYVRPPRGGLKNTARTAPAKFRCTERNGKFRLHIDPKGRKTLHGVVGKHVQVGIASPSDATSGAPVTVTFKSPR